MSSKILIIKPSSLGDIVHALPAVGAVRDANPKADITWVINPEWAPLLRGNRDIDHVHIFPRGEFRGFGAPTNLLPWLRETRRLEPDVALDFQGLLRSALIAKASGAKKIYGMSDGREGSRLFFNVVAQVDRQEHAVDRYLKLADAFGAPATSGLRFPIPTGDPLPRFDPYPGFVVLHPFARGRRKSISNSAITEFCRALAPARVVVVGKSHRRFSPLENCVNLTNQTSLLQLTWLLRKAAYVISVDSGPMHIAAAVTTNLTSIHTWTDPRRVGPYNAAASVWKNGHLYRVADLTDGLDLRKGRKFKREDVAPIATLARHALAKQPTA
ncbi:MAG: glycosyltransferase family 9 protein [Verrucomicrobiota bacterium]|nr:glycosyltransferase family 9 protein [Verrucomicrobiota bacterium]